MQAVILDTDVFSFGIKGDSRAALYEAVLRGSLACLSLMTVAEVKRWPREKRWGPLKIESLERAIALHTIVLPDMPPRTAGRTSSRRADGLVGPSCTVTAG